jgi:hypothetical protein
MKHKVKKFGRGGDILTALGAGLAGYGAYKYLTKDKDKDDDYTRRVKEYGTKGKFPEEKSEEKADAKKAEAKVADDRDEARERALRQSKDPKSNLVPEGADRDALYESDKALVRTDRKAPPAVNQGGKKKPAPAPQQNQNKNRQGSSTTTGVDAGVEAGRQKRSGESTSKSMMFAPPPAAEAKKAVVKTADKPVDTSVPKGFDTKSTNKTVYGTDTTSVFQRKAAQERADKEAKAKKEAEAEKKRRNRPSSEEMMTQSLGGGFKRGGAIKTSKMGSVKTAKPTMRSASARADGIAIRGKTRA